MLPVGRDCRNTVELYPLSLFPVPFSLVPLIHRSRRRAMLTGLSRILASDWAQGKARVL
jgi:hypothetical protein